MNHLRQKITSKICILLAGTFVVFILGGVIGIQFFYDEFLTLKTQLKDTLGIVTEADLALVAAQETQAEVEQALLDIAVAETIAAQEAAAEEQAAADAALEQEWIEIIAAEAAVYMRTITVNGQDMTVDLAAGTHTWFDAYEMRTDVPNTFVFGDFSGYDVIFEGQAVEEGSTVEISLDTLSCAIGLELIVTDQETGITCYYYIRTLHSEYDCLTYGTGDGDGYYYFTNANTMYKMDMSGNVVYYKQCPYTTRVDDFKQTIVDGVVYYSYTEYTEQGDASVSSTYFKATIMDANYQVIDEVNYLSTEQGVAENCSIDMHEFVVLGEGHYMYAAYVYQTVDNIPTTLQEDGTANVQAAIVQEVKDGELLFQWSSTDYPEFYETSVRAERIADDTVTTYIDYMHFNSIAIDPDDNNIIMSFRSQSALVKVDRETGEIIWILGGEGDMFGLTDEQKMSYQHFPQILEDGTITVFDNGSDYEQTRAIEYLLDEENLTLLEFNAYQIDGWYAASRGSAIRLSDDSALYLMGWGQAEPNNVVFTEINFDTGEILFQLVDNDCDDSVLVCSYRVYKFDS